MINQRLALQHASRPQNTCPGLCQEPIGHLSFPVRQCRENHRWRCLCTVRHDCLPDRLLSWSRRLGMESKQYVQQWTIASMSSQDEPRSCADTIKPHPNMMQRAQPLKAHCRWNVKQMTIRQHTVVASISLVQQCCPVGSGCSAAFIQFHAITFLALEVKCADFGRRKAP